MAKRMEILKEESEKHHFTNVWTTGGKVCVQRLEQQ